MKIIATPSTGSGQTGIEDPPLIVRILVVWVCPPAARTGAAIRSIANGLRAETGCQRKPEMAPGMSLSERPDGKQNKRFRAAASNRPKQDHNFIPHWRA